MRFSLFALSAVLLSCAFSAQAKMYKWVDENGQMHFGDKIPQEYVTKAHDELNEKGFKTKHREAAKTAEEKAEENRLKAERDKVTLEANKQKQLDRILLDSYSTERDLVIARDSRLDAIAAQIHLSEAYISESTKKIASMEQQVAQIKTLDREVPANLYENIDSAKQQVVVQTRVLEDYKKRSAEITEQFDGYIARFRVVQQR